MKLQYLLPLVLITLVSSCAPTIKNFEQYQKQFLNKSKFTPSAEELAGKSPKVVVFQLDENGNEVAAQAALGNSVAANIEGILGKSRSAQIVDRKVAAKLKQEIALAEMNKTGSYKGPDIADYAISGVISNASFTKKYSDTDTCFDPALRQSVPMPPHFEYSSEIAGNIKIYELPSLSVLDTIELEGSKTRMENVQKSGGIQYGALSIGGKSSEGANRDDNLVRKAAEAAIAAAETDLKNFFGKRGFIYEKRVFEDKNIFKINLGSSDGLKHGDKVEISGQYEVENPITGKAEIERRIIGSGTVTQLIDPKTSWIVLDNDKAAANIRLGDNIKVFYKKGFLHTAGGKFLMSGVSNVCGAK